MTSLIYIHYPGDLDSLFKEIVTLLNDELFVSGSLPVIRKEEYYLQVRRNKDAALPGTKVEKYNFMDLKYYVDFSPSDEMEEIKIVTIISKILEYFWNQNIAAVAESEYDELLPREGGTRGYDIPWPELGL